MLVLQRPEWWLVKLTLYSQTFADKDHHSSLSRCMASWPFLGKESFQIINFLKFSFLKSLFQYTKKSCSSHMWPKVSLYFFSPDFSHKIIVSPFFCIRRNPILFSYITFFLYCYVVVWSRDLFIVYYYLCCVKWKDVIGWTFQEAKWRSLLIA